MQLNQVKIGAAIVALSAALFTAHAFADTAPGAQADADAAVRHLVTQPPLVWPHNVSPEREARVTLRYTIEPDGHVDHVEALGTTTQPFADAAAAAVSARVYTPARPRRRARPWPSFTPHPDPSPAAAATPPSAFPH